MAEKKTFWLTDGYGTKAQVTGVEERDRWVPLGWSEATEPETGDWVWMRHSQSGGRQKFPAGVSETWRALGWEPSAPPEPVDVLHDEQLVDVAPASAPAAESKPTETTATSGNTKGK